MKSDKIPFPANDGTAWRVTIQLPVRRPQVLIEWIQGSGGVEMTIDGIGPMFIGTYKDFKERIEMLFTEVEKHLGES